MFLNQRLANQYFKKFGIKEEKLLSSSKFKHILADEIFAIEHPRITKDTFILKLADFQNG